MLSESKGNSIIGYLNNFYLKPGGTKTKLSLVKKHRSLMQLRVGGRRVSDHSVVWTVFLISAVLSQIRL